MQKVLTSHFHLGNQNNSNSIKTSSPIFNSIPNPNNINNNNNNIRYIKNSNTFKTNSLAGSSSNLNFDQYSSNNLISFPISNLISNSNSNSNSTSSLNSSASIPISIPINNSTPHSKSKNHNTTKMSSINNTGLVSHITHLNNHINKRIDYLDSKLESNIQNINEKLVLLTNKIDQLASTENTNGLNVVQSTSNSLRLLETFSKHLTNLSKELQIISNPTSFNNSSNNALIPPNSPTHGRHSPQPSEQSPFHQSSQPQSIRQSHPDINQSHPINQQNNQNQQNQQQSLQFTNVQDINKPWPRALSLRSPAPQPNSAPSSPFMSNRFSFDFNTFPLERSASFSIMGPYPNQQQPHPQPNQQQPPPPPPPQQQQQAQQTQQTQPHHQPPPPQPQQQHPQAQLHHHQQSENSMSVPLQPFQQTQSQPQLQQFQQDLISPYTSTSNLNTGVNKKNNGQQQQQQQQLLLKNTKAQSIPINNPNNYIVSLPTSNILPNDRGQLTTSNGSSNNTTNDIPDITGVGTVNNNTGNNPNPNNTNNNVNGNTNPNNSNNNSINSNNNTGGNIQQSSSLGTTVYHMNNFENTNEHGGIDELSTASIELTIPHDIQNIGEIDIQSSSKKKRKKANKLLNSSKQQSAIQSPLQQSSNNESIGSPINSTIISSSNKNNSNNNSNNNASPANNASGSMLIPNKKFVNVPQYKLEKSLKTVQEIWQEYEYGLNDKPPLKLLEAKYNTKWRNETESRTFLRRKKIYEAIEIGKTKGFDESTIIDELEQLRTYSYFDAIKKKPLQWLYSNIPPKYNSN